MSEQGRMLGAVALKSPAVGATEPAGERGSRRVPVPTVTTRKKTRVQTQGLSRRDLALLAFVGRFDQVTKKHIQSHIFKTNASETPCDRALKRLTNQGYLARINLPTVGGAFGGSGQYVYQIGPAGWKEAFPGRPYRLATAVVYHTLDIASVFVNIDNELEVVSYETEPDNWRTIAHMELKPDLYVEVDMGDRTRRAWLEIDLGTERPRQLRDKLHKYAYGLENASNKQRSGWPRVMWVVPDKKRQAELNGLIQLQPADSRAMYRVCLFADVVETLTGQ